MKCMASFAAFYASGFGGVMRRYLMWHPRRGPRILNLQSWKERCCCLPMQMDVGWMDCLGIGGWGSDGGGRRMALRNPKGRNW